MVIDHSGRLHKGVADCSADERKSALAQVFAHGFGMGWFRLGGSSCHDLDAGVDEAFATAPLPGKGCAIRGPVDTSAFRPSILRRQRILDIAAPSFCSQLSVLLPAGLVATGGSKDRRMTERGI